MAEKTDTEPSGVYIDASALAKLYVPEAESEWLDEFLQGRRDLLISELAITEVLSAVARRRREGSLTARQANQIRDVILRDSRSGPFTRLDLSPDIHRQAERMLLATDAVPFRTLDALHIALAVSGSAEIMVTFDRRMAEAASLHGLDVVDIGQGEPS